MKKIIKQNLLITFLLTFILTVSTVPAWGDSTNDNNAQTNSSGSNTQITGGYTSTTTNNNDGQTNNTTSTTTNNSTTNGSDVPVNSANAPSFLLCLKMYVALVLVVPCLLWVLAYLRASM